MSLLEVTDLRTEFSTDVGQVEAVRGTSFTLAEGEVLGIVGESGCGKSVTALSILRLIPTPPGRIAGGQILFDGVELLGLSDDEMRAIRGRDIGMIFQDPLSSLNPALRIGRQITEVLALHLRMPRKQADARAVELLSMVGIPDPQRQLNRYPHQLSGGMRQRVMIAIALSCNPRLLIADESTTALDVTIQAQILELLGRLRTTLNTAIMLITHDMGVVAGLADRVNVMYAGMIVESGTAESVFKSPRHPYTIGLLASIPRMDTPRSTPLRPIQGTPPDLISLPEGCAFRARCPFAIERCAHEQPPLMPVDDGHLAACWVNVETGAPVSGPKP